MEAKKQKLSSEGAEDGGYAEASKNPGFEVCSESKCLKAFQPHLFLFDRQKAVFRKLCRECTNKKKYYQKCRDRKRKLKVSDLSEATEVVNEV